MTPKTLPPPKSRPKPQGTESNLSQEEPQDNGSGAQPNSRITSSDDAKVDKFRVIVEKIRGIAREHDKTWMYSFASAMPIFGKRISCRTPIYDAMRCHHADNITDDSVSCLVLGTPLNPFVCVFKEENDTFMAVVQVTASGEQLLRSNFSEVKHVHDNFFLCTLGIDENTSEEQCVELAKLFRSVNQLTKAPLTVGQAFKQYYPKPVKNPIKGLPTYFHLDHDSINYVLRPTPIELWDMDTTTLEVKDGGTAEAEKDIVKKHTPCVFTGASGSGKTVSALMRTVDTQKIVVGLYVYDTNLPTDAEKFAERVAEKLITRCKMVEEHSKDLNNTAFYIVMDEMGRYKDAAHSIIKNGTVDFTASIKKKFEGYTVGDCDFFYSIVGTGVTGPSETGNSMPKGYDLVTPSTDTKVLFSNILMQKANGLNKVARERLYHAACEFPHLKALLTNRRCAHVMAASIGGLVNFHSKNVSKSDNTAKVFLTTHASFLEVNTTFEYVKLNGWGSKSKVQKRFYATWLLSLVFTQPHGYHLMVPEVATELAVTLGAVDDTLRVDTEKGGSVAKGRHHTHEFGYSPNDVQFKTTSTATTAEMYSSETYKKVNMRFVVPPASIIVALNVLTGTVGSETISASAYEVTIEAMVTAVLDAFTWFAAYHGKSEFTVPLHHMFPNTKDQLESAKIKLKVPGFIWDGATGKDKLDKFEGQCQQWQPVKVNDPQSKEGKLRVEQVIEAVEKQKAERGAAIIIAGDGTPLSDITIITPDLCIGVELKCYHKGGLVRVDTLSKRCYQTGFDALNLTTSYEEARFGSTDAKCIPSTVAEMFLYGAAPQSLPPDGEQNPEGTKEKDAVAALLSSGPNTLKLQIQSISDETSRFGRLVHMALRAGQSSLKEFLILVSPIAPLLPTEGTATFHSPHIATQDAKKPTVWKVSKPRIDIYHNNDSSCRILSAVVSTIRMSLRCSWKDKEAYSASEKLLSDVSSAKNAPSENSERVVDHGSQYEVRPANSLFFKVCDGWIVRDHGTKKTEPTSASPASNQAESASMATENLPAKAPPSNLRVKSNVDPQRK